MPYRIKSRHADSECPAFPNVAEAVSDFCANPIDSTTTDADEWERICYASEDCNAATVTEADAFLARVSREVRRILVLTGVVSADGGPAADEFYIAEVGEK